MIFQQIIEMAKKSKKRALPILPDRLIPHVLQLPDDF
jgi:hypothetical protein